MDGCQTPKCHEAMLLKLKGKADKKEVQNLKTCTAKNVPKKALWIALVALGLPLLITGIKVWSQQESDHLRYVEKTEMAEHKDNMTKIQVVVEHLAEDMRNLRKDFNRNQDDAKRDRQEILRRLKK